MIFDRTRRLVSVDTETHRVQPGLLTPPLVCGSLAEWPNRDSARLLTKDATIETFAALLQDKTVTIVGANIAFDFGVVVNVAPSLLKLVFQAYKDGRVFDVLIAQALDAVAHGHLGLMPNGMRMTNSKGKQTKRYSLDLSVRLTLHRYDAKENDFYQVRYAILEPLPQALWPAEAKQYPVDDAWNQVEVAARQLAIPAPIELPVFTHPVFDSADAPSWVHDEAQDEAPPPPALVPFRNLNDHANQAYSAWALHLGAAWGFRTSPLRTELLRMRALELHKVYVERFAKVGYYKPDKKSAKLLEAFKAEQEAERTAHAEAEALAALQDDELVEEALEGEDEAADAEEDEGAGTVAEQEAREKALLARLGYTKDTTAVARAAADAYGAQDPCPRCGGEGRVRKVKQVACRGKKVGGRYKIGCLANSTCVCGGSGVVDKPGNIVLCHVKVDGCGGSGYDIDPKKVPSLPRTKKNGISTSRDTLMESGDHDLHDFGLGKQAKILKTYLPFITKGNKHALTLKPNVILESGRTSYEELIQTFPRWKLDGFVPGSPGLEQALALAEAYGDQAVMQALMPKIGKDGKLKPGWVPSPRECFVARPGRVLGSTDYAALELCSLAMVCLFICKGHSRMAEIINETKQPGHLHSALGAKFMGISFEEMLKRLKAHDSTAKNFRQAAKPCNFGLPGGMKAATLVLTSRLEHAGETEGPDGRKYAGIRFCILVGGAERCGDKKVTVWKRQVIPPTCLACLKLAEELLIPSWFAQYPEMEDYFAFVERWLLENNNEIPCFGPWMWDESLPKAERKPHRIRGGCGKRDGANNGFQGLAADGAKDAYREVVCESYTDEESVLYKAKTRAPGFIHDELLTEMDAELAHLAGLRVEEVMVARMRVWIPDVHIEAKTALMHAWSKDAEPVYAADGKLVPWVPKEFE